MCIRGAGSLCAYNSPAKISHQLIGKCKDDLPYYFSYILFVKIFAVSRKKIERAEL
jgi:hypothetical protein